MSHFCPFCRADLMTENHAPTCEPGDLMSAQFYRLGLHVDAVTDTIVTEARQSLLGRLLVWVVDHLPGHSVSRRIIR